MTTRGFSIIKVVSDAVVEPVTMDMLKKYVEIDFDAHNDLLVELLTSAREQMEKFLCVSLVPTTITARWEELTTQELPYGPVREVISVTDISEDAITGHALEGLLGSYMSLKANRSSPTIINYKAGYVGLIPAPIRLGIMKIVCDDFEQRTGVNVNNIGVEKLPNNWRTTARPYRRLTWAD